jgi:hypothetical protein
VNQKEVKRTQPEGPERELDVEEASNKHHMVAVTERFSERWHKFPSDIMAWHGGGQSVKNECL